MQPERSRGSIVRAPVSLPPETCKSTYVVIAAYDEEEGRKSLFGGLAASGWHVAAVCMKLLVADGQRLAREAAARGEQVAVGGPSPGFRELRWLKPVLAGDTIRYSSRIETKRTSEKRPEWGILQIRNTGTNQRGEVVYSFLATAFVQRRNPGA